MKLIITNLYGVTKEETETAIACFPPARRAEINRLLVTRDRARSAVAEATVRLEIMRTLHIPDADINIARTENGKPYLCGYDGFCFNLSHSGDYAVCVTDSLPVGADVEQIRPIDHAAIAERWFTPQEREEIARSDNPLPAFFRVWTAKESVSKWLGTGISEQWKTLNVAAGRSRADAAYEINSYGLAREADALSPLGGSSEYALSVCRAPGGGTTDVRFCRADVLLHEYLAAHLLTK